MNLVRVAVLVASALLMAALPASAVAAEVSTVRLREMVQVLTAPALAGRGSGSDAAVAAADTLAAWMERGGLEPAFAGSWFQEVPLKGEGWAGQDLNDRSGRNVGGILPGRGNLADRYLVVGAHYDHLGLVDLSPEPEKPPSRGAYYPGANDNASGVALVFEIIRLMTTGAADSPPVRSVLFVCFAAEEVGLQGSGHLVAHLPVPADRVDAMINIDTVGQLTDNRLHVSGVGTAAEFADLVAAADAGDLDLALARGGWSGSDHMSFNTREIPVLFIFGGAYPQYNRSSDEWDTLDYPALARVTGYTLRLAELVRRETGQLDWVMVAEKELRTDEEEQGDQNRQTWLGTLPDFTEEVKGYKLAGVFDGSPAARAGLAKGDVLLSLGGRPVEDLATFTRALRTFLPGDLVEITLTRGGTQLNYTVVLGDRADRP